MIFNFVHLWGETCAEVLMCSCSTPCSPSTSAPLLLNLVALISWSFSILWHSKHGCMMAGSSCLPFLFFLTCDCWSLLWFVDRIGCSLRFLCLINLKQTVAQKVLCWYTRNKGVYCIMSACIFAYYCKYTCLLLNKLSNTVLIYKSRFCWTGDYFERTELHRIICLLSISVLPSSAGWTFHNLLYMTEVCCLYVIFLLMGYYEILKQYILLYLTKFHLQY